MICKSCQRNIRGMVRDFATTVWGYQQVVTGAPTWHQPQRRPQKSSCGSQHEQELGAEFARSGGIFDMDVTLVRVLWLLVCCAAETGICC